MKNNTIVYSLTQKGEPAIAKGDMDSQKTDDKKMNPALIVALIVLVYFIAR
jgi:hypothetical protein